MPSLPVIMLRLIVVYEDLFEILHHDLKIINSDSKSMFLCVIWTKKLIYNSIALIRHIDLCQLLSGIRIWIMEIFRSFIFTG